ncbi:hypothetical protein [Phenylobacterium sp.]|jgi:hypothetical protein|uniref:hypothetical protein n=1 Tax=Phenylobacterium sp. TaxID=1871053 RepID=UPI00378479ED
MPEKHENTERWGGPGASHEDRTRPQPKKVDPRAPGEPTNTPYSGVSGGGGERDRHHSHDPAEKRDFEQNSEQRRKHGTQQ